jgi:hypothetical protein
MPQEIPTPDINERFIAKPRFGPKIVRMLNADGHIDVAHKMGLVSLKTTLVEYKVEDIESENEEKERFISRTRWATVIVTAKVKAPDGSIIECDGMSCVNDRDTSVKKPGYEVSVAETRAMKRALASACNITERFIDPKGDAPTREFVDMPLRKDETDEKPGLPDDVLRRPDITPPIKNLKPRMYTGGGDQFEI